MSNFYRFFTLAVAATGAVSAPLHAQTTGTLEGFGGITSDERPISGPKDEFSGGATGSLAFGTGTVLVQGDALVADHRRDTFAGGAAHIGFKVGAAGYVGAYGSYMSQDDSVAGDMYRAGAEVGFGSGAVRVSGVAGYEHAERGSVVVGTIPGFTVVDTYGKGSAFFDLIDVIFTPADKIALSAGHRYTGGVHAGAASAQVAVSQGVSLFAEGRLGEDSYRAVWAGIRISFGGSPVTTIRDGALLPNRLKDDLFTVENRRNRRAVALPPPPPPPSGCGSCGGYCSEGEWERPTPAPAG